MKILFVISSLGSGGAERVVVNLANYLVKRHEVVIATFSNDKSFYELDSDIKHLKLDLLKESRNFIGTVFNSIKRLFVLLRCFNEENPDVIVSFMTHTNLLSIIAAKIAKKSLVISERIAYDFYGQKINFLKRLLYPLSDLLVIQTQGDAKNYPYVKKIAVIPNPLSFEIADELKKEKIVLAVGRLEEQKGFDGLIEIFASIDSDYELIIVGEGSQRGKLEAMIRKCNAKNVRLLGRRRDIQEYYKRAAIFALSSQREGFPNVLIEAMAHGCAVVSYDCDFGPREIIDDGINGFLVPNQDRESFKEKLELLMNDIQLRTDLGKNAMQIKEKFSIEKIGERWEKVLRDCKRG